MYKVVIWNVLRNIIKFVKNCVFYWLWGGGGGRGYIFICFFKYILMSFWYDNIIYIWYVFNIFLTFLCRHFSSRLILGSICLCVWMSVCECVCYYVCKCLSKEGVVFLIYVGNRAYPLRVELNWIQASNYFERKFTKIWSSLTNWSENGSNLAPKKLFRLDWDFWTLITGFSMLELV